MTLQNNEHLEEAMNRAWSGDIISLTTAEVYAIVKNTMWNNLLIDAYDISVSTKIGDGVGNIKIVIEGQIYIDPKNIVANNDTIDEMFIADINNDMLNDVIDEEDDDEEDEED